MLVIKHHGSLAHAVLLNTRFTNIFLPRRLPRCRKRHQSIYSRVKDKQCRILQIFIHTSYFLCAWSWHKMHCIAISQKIKHILLSETAHQL